MRPGKSISIIALGEPIDLVVPGPVHRNTLWTYRFGAATVAAGFTHDGTIDLIESHSTSLRLNGRLLGRGYRAFASSLRDTGWRFLSFCGPGADEGTATTGTLRAGRTFIAWAGTRVFVAISHHLIPRPSFTCPPAHGQ